MKNLLLLILLTFTSLTFAHTHNMIMLGEKEVFLSHIVYKVPHNFQVILKVKLDDVAMENYERARPTSSLMILLLDHMDISQIQNVASVTGTMFSEDESGNRTEIQSRVKIERADFEVIYFDELPLSLSR